MNRLLPLLASSLFLAFTPLSQAQPKTTTLTTALSRSALQPGQDAVVAVALDIKPGFHSQSHTPKDPDLIALNVTATKTDGVTIGDIVYPPAKEESFPALGVLSIYSGKVIFYVPIKVADDANPGPLTLKGTIKYQICDDNSCFAPETKPWSVETKVAARGEASEATSPELFKDYKPAAASTTRSTTAPVKQGASGNSAGPPPVTVDDGNPTRSLISALGLAFLAGILFNIVPCVLPMLPIKVLGFAEIAKHNRGKTIALSSVFGLGIVTVFAALAILILPLKAITWGQQFSNPIFAWGAVVLLLVLSFWLFGLFDVNLPSGAYGFAPRHDTIFGNYLWGVLTAVLSTPCT